ncbi:GNAT family N-acetyltransferase [Morganella morganii]|uniref:GNAT family N-acetyltransferase n=1 Tax=Morganella morganii TaxID=582 RepID=UPI0034D7934E
MMTLLTRQLERQEIPQVWSIDRTELIEHLYLHQHGELVLSAQRFDMRDWPEGEAEHYTPILLDSFDRGAPFSGVFDGETLVAAASVDPRPVAFEEDETALRQLSFLHISKAYRGRGIGRQLFVCCETAAKEMGAKGFYVSSIPSENTVHFYQHLGCELIAKPDPALFALEPEDIHFVFLFRN